MGNGSSVLNYVADHPKLAGCIACVAIAITFAPKASVVASWVALSIAWGFAVGMMAGLPVIKNTNSARAWTGMAAVVLLVVLVLFGRWLTDQKAGGTLRNPLIALGVLAKAWIDKAWIQRLSCVAAGMLLLYVLQISKRAVFTISTARTRRRSGDKGLLDYKLQAEEAMSELPRVLAPISETIAQVGRSMDAGTLRVKGALLSPTKIQLKQIKRTARELDRHTRELQSGCDDLDRVGEAVSQGTRGWLNSMSSEQRRSVSVALQNPLQTLVHQLDRSSAVTEQYLEHVLGLQGVSQDMNAAAQSHARAVMRIREATAKIRQSCADGLLVLEHDQTSGERSLQADE